MQVVREKEKKSAYSIGMPFSHTFDGLALPVFGLFQNPFPI